jgi:hypothetical protein
MSFRRASLGLLLITGLGLTIASGCFTLPLPGPPPYNVVLGAGYDPTIHHRLLLMPIAGVDADPVADGMITNALYNELRTVGPFEVIKAPPIPCPACEPGPPPLPTEQQIAEMISLHRPDALVFVTVTSYSPYPPLELGIAVRVVSAIDRQPLASMDTTRYAAQDIPFSNGDCVVAHPADDLLLANAAAASTSPRQFVRYVSMHVAHALALDPLPLPPTSTGSGWSILPKPGPSRESCEHSPRIPSGPL